MEIKIFKEEDRLTVAAILIKNGYTVSQGKRLKTPKGKSYEYYLRLTKDEVNEDCKNDLLSSESRKAKADQDLQKEVSM